MTSDEIALYALLAGPIVLAALFGLGRERAALGLAVFGSWLLFLWSLLLGAAVVGANGPVRVDRAWLEAIGVRWQLNLDGVSAPFVVLTTLVTACCLVSLIRHAPECGGRGWLATLLLVIETGSIGAFLAQDMVLFFVFFEVALIPMWFVIQQWGDPHDPDGRRRAANRFLLFTVLGSALMLVGFVLVGGAGYGFDIQIAAGELVGEAGYPLAAVFVGIGLAVKTPLWPVHVWLPDAHAKAPTVGSVILAAILLKLGTYGFIRFWLPLVDPGDSMLPIFAGLAVIGIVYGSLACLAQTDLKRLIAYSSVGHMGFVVLAVATYTLGGVQAAVYASVAHGLITGLLFFAAGAIKERYGTGDLAELKALYGAVPRLAGVMAFAAMASLGLPGLAGFWGEMLAIRAGLYPDSALPRETFVVLAVIAAFGVILTSAYFLKLMRSMLQGPRWVVSTDASSASAPVAARPAGAGSAGTARPALADLSPWEWAAWAPLLLGTLVLGVVPGPLLSSVAESTAFLGLMFPDDVVFDEMDSD